MSKLINGLYKSPEKQSNTTIQAILVNARIRWLRYAWIPEIISKVGKTLQL